MVNDEITISQVKLLDDYDTLKQVVAENFTNQGLLKSYDIVIDSDHALFVEYGTGPSNAHEKMYDQFGQTVQSRIAEWVDEKFGNRLNPRQRQEMAFSVYKRIMEEGIPPQPFIRPAVDAVAGDTEIIQSIFDSGGDPMLRLAEYTVHVMIENLYINGTVYHHGIERDISIVESTDIPVNNDEGDV